MWSVETRHHVIHLYGLNAAKNTTTLSGQNYLVFRNSLYL